jgi:hypothetical protein
MNYTLTVTLTEAEAQALTYFISREFGMTEDITKNLTEYPVTVALNKLGAALQRVSETA